MSYLIDTKIADGEVNYMMTRLYPGHELPQFQELVTKKSEQVDPGTEDSIQFSSVQSLSHVRLFATP